MFQLAHPGLARVALFVYFLVYLSNASLSLAILSVYVHARISVELTKYAFVLYSASGRSEGNQITSTKQLTM